MESMQTIAINKMMYSLWSSYSINDAIGLLKYRIIEKNITLNPKTVKSAF